MKDNIAQKSRLANTYTNTLTQLSLDTATPKTMEFADYKAIDLI